MMRLFRSALGRQSLWHFSSQALNALLGLAVLGVLTRSMTVEQFGLYSFVLTVLTFIAVFFDAGIFASATRLMAVADGAEYWHARAGALLLAAAALGVLLAAFTALASLAVDPLFGRNAGHVLLLVSPLAIVFPLQEMLLSIAQGSNRIRFLSVYMVLPRILLLPALMVMALGTGVAIEGAVLLTLVTTAVSIAVGIAYLRPRFRRLRGQFSILRVEMREFGRDMYLGRVIDGLTSGLDKMLLSMFHGMASLGFYTVALTMVSPIGMFSRAVAVSAYKRFATERRIARAILLGNLAWCTAGTLLLVIACEFLIPVFFTGKYSASLAVLPFLAAGVSLLGLNGPFHSFLAAQRQGRSMRMMAVSTSTLNIILNVSLIPLFAMTGAAVALISTYALNIAMNLHYYRKHITAIEGTADA
ncbi:MAG: oligosaccharide flippase family protein [Ignavibacteria bacterium]|nr:oligosaccharide flippase family protein [Ignavibacteria bacterium]